MINDNSKVAILYTGVLNDDMIIDNDSNGVDIIYYTYCNEWSNDKHIKHFNNYDDAIAWYKDKFNKRVIDDATIE